MQNTPTPTDARVAALINSIDEYRDALKNTVNKGTETLTVANGLSRYGSGSEFIKNSGIREQQRNVNTGIASLGVVGGGGGIFLATAVGAAAVGPFGIFIGAAGLIAYGAKRFVNNYEKKLKDFASSVDEAKSQLNRVALEATEIAESLEGGARISKQDLEILNQELDELARDEGLQEKDSIRPDRSAHSDVRPTLNALKDARHRIREITEDQGGTSRTTGPEPTITRPGLDRPIDPPTIGR